MATTTNYGWTTPDDTALVKDGASAIRALGTAIDTSMNTALGTKKAGMVLLNTTSFSAVASQSVNDVFSATYDNYRLVFYFTAPSADSDVQFRLRVSGADNSTSNYYSAFAESNSSAVTNRYNTGITNWEIMQTDLGTTSGYAQVIELQNPFNATRTTAQLISIGVDSTGAYRGRSGGAGIALTTSFTGFTIYPGSGTISGKVSVYGYNL